MPCLTVTSVSVLSPKIKSNSVMITYPKIGANKMDTPPYTHAIIKSGQNRKGKTKPIEDLFITFTLTLIKLF